VTLLQPASPRITQVAEHFFRQEGARLVATLTAHLGTHQLQLAEDVVQEALVPRFANLALSRCAGQIRCLAHANREESRARSSAS